MGSASGLTATPTLTMTGEASGDYFGYSVGTAGDVNGDGYADVIVGAHKYNNFTGRVYVYLGSANGLSATPTFTATGEAVGDRLGFPAATSGDVNGDGYADIIIGASGNYSSTGRAYVYLGSASGLKATPGLTVTGEMTSSYLGISVGMAGDVNGDGYADFIAGAIGYDNYTGRAYVYHGAADAPGSTPVFTATGIGNIVFGWSVATAGDVNGDGYADVVIGATGYDNFTGRIYVYTGTPTGLNITPAFTATGEAASSFFGNSVGMAGDVNSDGYDDVIIAAGGYNNFTGRVYVYMGSAMGLNNTPVFTATGEATNNLFGVDVGTAGDVNGDGYADVVIADAGYLNQTGRVYVYLGSASGLSATPAFTATGEATGIYFGNAAGTAGDVNGDSYSDIIVGAPGNLSGGRTYLYFGSASGLSASSALTLTDNVTDSLFGRHVGTAGDVNGDGYSDVIIGAPDIDTADPGRAYIYLGIPAGLNTTPAFTVTDGANSSFGWTVATAGDVNGDGYTDVGIGAYQHLTYTGRIYIYAGSASGLSTTRIFTASGGAVNDQFGFSLATTGDVNGDGYSELLVGARGYNNSTGRACLYPGNGSYGVSLNPRQRRSDDTAPIAHGGQSDSATSFRLAAVGRSPFGRGKVKLEWEVKPLGTPFDGMGTQQSAAWLDSGTAGVGFNELVTGLSANTVYHWRVRVRYHPASTPFQQYSRWFTQPWNGWQEADLRTAAGSTLPPIKLYLPFIAR